MDNEGARFENFVACGPKTLLTGWQDAAGVPPDRYDPRNKERQETDLVVVRRKRHRFPAEAKRSDTPVEKHHPGAQPAPGGIPIVQACRDTHTGVASMQRKDAWRVSACRFFGGRP